MYLMEKFGHHALYQNVINSSEALKGYVEQAKSYKEEMPLNLLNASEYTEKILGAIPDMSLAVARLVTMARPYVLYVLFKAVGQDEYVKEFKHDFEEVLRRYPSTLDNLPGMYRILGSEVTDE